MLRLEDEVLIACPAHALYRLVSDVERHAEILPGYLESRIIDRESDACLVQREAIIDGRIRRWKSEVRFDPDRALHFRQMEGPLKGMQVSWELHPHAQGTSLRIIHQVDIRPWWKTWVMERWIAKPAIKKTARLVLKAIKQTAEQENRNS